ncbi:MAG: recombinase RecT [Clostridia bacterium]|nr:recombinase RecT [Clostridia bacterium]
MTNNNLTKMPEQKLGQDAVKETAGLVAQYAQNLFKDRRSQEFAARVSILAKQDPLLKEAIEKNPDSFVIAMMACIQLDLMPNTPQDYAYILPYNDKTHGRMARFQISYKGLKELAYRSGEVKSINGEIVFEGDTFDVEFGTNRKLTHKPNFNIDRTDFSKATHAYITVVLANGEKPFFVMTKKEIEKIREDTKKRNFGKDSPAWANWWDQQALKTVLKRAAKMLPSSTKDNRLAFAAQIDSLSEAGKLTLGIDGVEERRPVIKPRLNDEARADIQKEAASIANEIMEGEVQDGA